MNARKRTTAVFLKALSAGEAVITAKYNKKKCKLGEAVSSALNHVNGVFPSPKYLEPYLNKNTYDMGAAIDEVLAEPSKSWVTTGWITNRTTSPFPFLKTSALEKSNTVSSL